MKDLFPGYFKESEEDYKKIWKESLFVFDANILLNLYRYSDGTRNEFLSILEALQDQAWLPNRAAEEYLSNRLSVIGKQEASYDETVKSINALKINLENTREHPFVSTGIMEELNSVFEKLSNELNKNKSVHTDRINSDDIQDSISKLFENKVGEPYDQDKLDKLFLEGEERYKQKIPPGFKDESKSGDSDVFSDQCRKYGDLIVWNQVIDNAIERKKSVILVTDDKKEDWWEKFKGRTIGPRPELVREFKERVNNNFSMYQADRFLELAKENLNEEVSEKSVEEVREVRLRDLSEAKRLKVKLDSDSKRGLPVLRRKADHIRTRISACHHEIDSLKRTKENLMEFRNSILSENAEDDNYRFNKSSSEIDEIIIHLEKSNENLVNLESQLSMVEQQIGHYKYFQILK